MTPQRLSFARALPILALLLSYVIIAVPATMTYIGLRHISRHGRGVSFHSHAAQFTIPPEHFLRDSVRASAGVTSRYIQGLNMAGFLTELAVDRCLKTWPREWIPHGLDAMEWRALFFPICCLPFWWFAGFGADGLVKVRKLSWLVLLVGTTLCICFAAIEAGIFVDLAHGTKDGATPLYWACGVGLWTVLFSAFPIAWLNQTLARRRTKRILHARLSAELQ